MMLLACVVVRPLSAVILSAISFAVVMERAPSSCYRPCLTHNNTEAAVRARRKGCKILGKLRGRSDLLQIHVCALAFAALEPREHFAGIRALVKGFDHRLRRSRTMSASYVAEESMR